MIPIEPVSLTIGAVALASLFSLCVQCFDLIEIGRSLGPDGELFAIKLSIEKRRLMIWGEAVGILRPDTNRDPGLDEPGTRQLIEQILGNVQKLFHQADDLKSKYGLEAASSTIKPNANTVNGSTVCITSFERSPVVQFQAKLSKHHDKIGLAAKTKWAIRDCKKFASLVQNLKDLLDGLNQVTMTTSTAVLKGQLIRQETDSIPDLRTLRLIENTCSDEDWRSSASAASDYFTDLNRITPRKRKEIIDWIDNESEIVDQRLPNTPRSPNTSSRADISDRIDNKSLSHRVTGQAGPKLKEYNWPYCGDKTKLYVLCSSTTLVAIGPSHREEDMDMEFYPVKPHYGLGLTAANVTTATRMMKTLTISKYNSCVVVYCPPRMSYIRMALVVMDHCTLMPFKPRCHIRLDDRLLDFDTESNSKELVRDRMMAYHKDLEVPNFDPTVNSITDSIDMNWLEQRIDVIDTPSYVLGATRLDWSTIFRQSRDDGDQCAAIIVLATLPACEDMLDMAPVAPPVNLREGRIYQLRALEGADYKSTLQFKAEHFCNVAT